MNHELNWRRVDLEEQLLKPWNWTNQQERFLDGWKINRNRLSDDRYLMELGKEFGPITVPHRQR